MDIIDRALGALEWNVSEAPRGVLEGERAPSMWCWTGAATAGNRACTFGHHPLDVVDRANRLMAVLHVTEATA